MRKQFAKQNRSLLLFLLLFFVSINSYADWEQVKQLDATYATFVTKSGNIRVSPKTQLQVYTLKRIIS